VIDGDYSWVSDSFGVYAIGSGAQFALGSLATAIPTGGKVGLGTAKQAALKAMGVAGRYDPGTAAPYQTFVQTASTTGTKSRTKRKSRRRGR